MDIILLPPGHKYSEEEQALLLSLKSVSNNNESISLPLSLILSPLCLEG
jgi:hypothetical protein